jgi:hypothetical protein
MNKNNWTKTVATINREKFTVPDGWDTREKVALDLQCAPDRVADLLKPGIASGQIERQDFPVWDEARRMTTRVVCYRVVSVKTEAAPTSTTTNPEFARIERALHRDSSLSNYQIAKNNRSTSGQVAIVRASLGL